MSSDFKPSTRRLIQLLGWEGERFSNAQAENYLIRRVIVDIGNRVYREVGEENYRNEAWPVDPVLAAALRQALGEHPEGGAGEDLAFVLMRSGAQDREVLGRLHPTDRLIYRWIEQGLGASDVAAILREAGVIESVAGADLARIDAWLAKPLTAYGKFDSIVHALFDHENRLVHACVRDPGFELHHDELLSQLVASVAPPIVIEEVSQSDSPSETLIDVTEGMELTMQVDGGTRTFRVEGDPQLAQEGVRVYQHDGRRIVRFRHAGKTHGFFVESRGTWMDFPAVLQGVDAFMTDLGRPERAFQFAEARGENSEWLLFLVADPARLVPAAERLGLPVSRQRSEPPAPAA